MKAYNVTWTIRKTRRLGFVYLFEALQFLKELQQDKKVKKADIKYSKFIGNVI